MDLIKIKDVTKTYKNGVTALYNVSLDIKKGEFVFVIGATGCGKSTLIKTMYREEKPEISCVIAETTLSKDSTG